MQTASLILPPHKTFPSVCLLYLCQKKNKGGKEVFWAFVMLQLCCSLAFSLFEAESKSATKVKLEVLLKINSIRVPSLEKCCSERPDSLLARGIMPSS